MCQLSYCSQTISLREREHLRRVASSWLEMTALCSCGTQTPECPWSKWNAVYVYSHSMKQTTPVSCERKHQVPSDLFIAFLFWSRQYDRQMQSGCNERRCYSEDGLRSPLNSGDKDIIRHYLCVQARAQPYLFSWQRPSFQEETMASGWRSSVVIEY